MSSSAWRHGRLSRLALFGTLGIAATLLAVLSFALPPVPASHLTSGHQVTATAVRGAQPLAAAPASGAPSLSLGIYNTPTRICAFDAINCQAAAPATRVTMTATGNPGPPTWPAVQIAFVIETSPYDGVWDPNGDGANGFEKWPVGGYDVCANKPNGVPCEESNAVPFFIAHAGAIAARIQSNNPHTQVSFAMVDYLGSCDNWDDYCDAPAYHVDIPHFVNSADLGSLVVNDFQGSVLNGGWVYHDADLADNFLHSPSITALYGTLMGSGLDWSNNTHHVIVWLGSTAPRDPSYQENYCASPSGLFWDSQYNCYPPTCEPSYQFTTGARSPQCEGWVHSQDGLPGDSIAALAHTAPSCVGSLGHTCTIDTIDVWSTPTDPYSQGWPSSNQAGQIYGPGNPMVIADSTRILQAGCDLAFATGGTWNGPSFFTCSDGQTGGLQYVPHGPINNPNTANPTLYAAMGDVGFGAVTNELIANGTNRPMFQFVPAGNLAISPLPEYQVACTSSGVLHRGCQGVPTMMHSGALAYYGWNWSTNASQNQFYAGDLWTMSFNVIAKGPPYATVPVDACYTTACRMDGALPINGVYTWATYQLATGSSTITQSFPVTQVLVEVAPAVPPNFPPPPASAPPGLGIPIAAPTTTPIPNVIGIFTTSLTGNVSIQSSAAGVIMAGLTRVMMKNKPIAMQMAMKQGPGLSKFDAAKAEGQSSIGRTE